MTPKRQRLWFVVVSMVCLCVATLLILNLFKQNIVFFYSPTDLSQQTPSQDQVLRIGGLVKTGSLEQDGENVSFTVTDNRADINVHYTGLLPNLFREGQGVVAEGKLGGNGTFVATRVLAKHDENYMPREVVDALKQSGRWQEGEGMVDNPKTK